MRRATITLPDGLETELDSRFVLRQYRPPSGPLEITPAEEGSGFADTSEKYDRNLVAAASYPVEDS